MEGGEGPGYVGNSRHLSHQGAITGGRPERQIQAATLEAPGGRRRGLATPVIFRRNTMLSTILILGTIIPPEPKVLPIEKEFPAKAVPRWEKGWKADGDYFGSLEWEYWNSSS